MQISLPQRIALILSIDRGVEHAFASLTSEKFLRVSMKSLCAQFISLEQHR